MNLNHLALVVAVAEHGSLRRAAEAVGTDAGNLSRAIRACERDLGVALFTRAARRVTPTAAGAAFVASIGAPLANLASAAARLHDRADEPRGLVTLTAPPDLGPSVIAPILGEFRRAHPEVRVRLVLDVALVRVGTDADLAVRAGPGGPGRLRARRLGDVRAGFFAAPKYLARRGVPASVAELPAHDGLWPARPRRRSFADAAHPPPPTIDCDDFATLLALAKAGAGIAVLPLHLAAVELGDGGLVRVLPQLTLPGAPLRLVTAPERPLPPRVAALRDFLIARVPARLGS
ncbi:MAG: LysR family transcriptional regulator [Nannocystaceae bacterium]|nr:LysR family transcriptional regulator [Nannocystaceae bacterium]